MEEHERLADELEQDADRMQGERDRLSEAADDTRADWERKRRSDQVPGADPPAEDEDAPEGFRGHDESATAHDEDEDEDEDEREKDGNEDDEPGEKH